jgi:hypothetical protein
MKKRSSISTKALCIRLQPYKKRRLRLRIDARNCYELPNHRTAYLAVIDRSALKDAPPESPVFDQMGKVATVSWSRGNHTYMIASTSGVLSDLMKLF